jgi:hypothetical protein
VSISIECPNGCRFQAPVDASASQIRCPSCRRVIVVDSQPKSGVFSATLLEGEQPLQEAADFLNSLNAGNREPVEFFPELRVGDVSPPPSTDVKTKDIWAQRVAQRLSGRRTSARLFAWSLVFLAVVTMIPPTLWWWEWTSLVANQTTLPRWVYLSLFLMGLQGFYALLVRLVPDWSSLRAASFFLLTLACLMAVSSAGLSLSLNSNLIARLLQVPPSLQARGTIWCLALVCLNLLLSFWAFREYSQWRRTEELFHELFPQTAVPST